MIDLLIAITIWLAQPSFQQMLDDGPDALWDVAPRETWVDVQGFRVWKTRVKVPNANPVRYVTIWIAWRETPGGFPATQSVSAPTLAELVEAMVKRGWWTFPVLIVEGL